MDAIVAGKQEKTEGSLVFKTYATATLTSKTNSQTDVYFYSRVPISIRLR